MMLSLSANTTETAIDLQMVNGSAASEAQGVPYANELAGFAEAVTQRDGAEIRRTRDELDLSRFATAENTPSTN